MENSFLLLSTLNQGDTQSISPSAHSLLARGNRRAPGLTTTEAADVGEHVHHLESIIASSTD